VKDRPNEGQQQISKLLTSYGTSSIMGGGREAGKVTNRRSLAAFAIDDLRARRDSLVGEDCFG